MIASESGPMEPSSLAAIDSSKENSTARRNLLAAAESDVEKRTLAASALAAGIEVRRKIVAAIKKNAQFGLKQHNSSPAHPLSEVSTISSEERTPFAASGASEKLSGDESSLQDNWAIKESWNSCGQTSLKLKFRRSQAISFFQSRRDVGMSYPVPKLDVKEDFLSVTDQELRSMILRQGLLSGLSGLVSLLAVAFCLMAMAGPSSNPRWVQCMDGHQLTCWIHPWANHLCGLLAACLCLMGCSWLGHRVPHKWPGSCQCCEGMVEKSNSRAEEAEQMAHNAHRAKQQFITYVFHNIRVPFNAIVLGLGHLRSTADKQASKGEMNENADLVQMMLDCAETMTSVLDDVTDMGQGEDGVIELNLEEFDLLGVVKFLSWGLKDLLYQKQICFIMNVDHFSKAVLTANHVIGDKHRVLQTLGNFLSNAVKFSPAGGRLELSIKCEEVIQKKAASLYTSGALYRADSLETQDCSLCPCLRVEGLSNPSKSHANAPCIKACCGERSFAKVLITVNDSGIGISTEDQAKLFEPYSFVTTGWAQKAGVSGLGLNMAKRFAEQSGGYIGVESREGKGSTFYFCLPYPLVPIKHGVEYNLPSKDEALDAFMGGSQEDFKTLDGHSVFLKGNSKILQEKNSLISSPVSSPKNSSRRRVLLVEDTEINRIILRKVLQNLNLNCEEAENGQVAVDFLKQGRSYDLILMDKEMPIMDGHEATRQLRMMGVKTPIVALTGNALQSDKELFFEAGVDDFQTKPLSRDKLVQLLARFGVEGSCTDRR